MSWDGLLTDDGNRIRSHSLVFKTANGVDRSGVFGTRDVQLGDRVRVTYGATTVDTKVSGIVADEDEAVTGAVTADGGNQAPIGSASATVTESIASSHFVPTADASSYDGIADGDVTEVYTVKITATDGEVADTVVSITSASGHDDVPTLLIADSGVAMPLGTRGATFTLTSDPSLASSSSSSNSSSSSESSSSGSMSSSSSSDMSMSESSSSESSNIDRRLVVGDYWVVEVEQAYSLPSPASGGTYMGIQDTTYLLEITQGGTVGTDIIKFRPSTTDGYDGGSEVSVTAAGAYTVGNYGVTITFHSGEQYVKGDVYLIVAEAQGKGACKTLVLADKLTGVTTTTPLAVTLGLEDTFELDDAEWTASASSITVAAGATHNASYLGVDQSFDILSGDLYMEYREALIANVNLVSSLSSTTDVEDVLGPVTPENPLAMMVTAALMGAAGTEVYYIATAGNDPEDYSAALDKLTEVGESYSLVPYNTSREVADLVEAHVEEMSSPTNSLFRILWRGLDIERLSALYDEADDGTALLATLNGTQLLSSNSAFITNGVEPGDLVRINYHQDGVGNVVYDTYTVDEVVAEDEIKLLSGPSSPLTPARKMEVWRNATLDQYADDISAEAIHHDNRRVTCVWSEPIGMLGHDDVSLAYLAALEAGMRSAGAPHQPMSLMTVPYITMDVQTNFGSGQLNHMAGNGVWLVVQDVDGTIYNRHQVTTDPSDVFKREQSVTTNLDHIARDYKAAVSDLYGKGNVSEEMLRLIEGRVDSTTSAIMSRTYSDIIGPQMDSIEITRLEVDPVLRDQVWVEMDIVLPVPMNHLVLKFRLI